MRKPKLIILKGLPYSGKTTWATEWARKSKRVRVSWSDILRTMGEGYEGYRQTLALDAALRIMRQAFRNGYDVCVDECNLYSAHWSMFATQGQIAGADLEFKLIKAAPKVCKERCEAAGGSSEDLARIDMLAEKYAEWLK